MDSQNQTLKLDAAPDIHCPVVRVPEVVPCDEAELEPLFDFLARDEEISEPKTFPRGTLLPDGRLDLCKQSVGVQGCRRLVDALSANSQVKSLLLGTDAIGDEGAAKVAELIERNPNLEIVYLGCNRITETGAKELARVLTSNQSVTGLWLKRNPIGNEGVEAVATMLAANSSLRTLDVVNCGISDAGLVPLCDVLRSQNRTLKRLYLGGNGLTSRSAPQLCSVLAENEVLEALLLNVSFFSDEGAKLLATGLKQNRSLRELGLGSNGIKSEGLGALVEALEDHSTLQNLDLGRAASQTVLGADWNHFSGEGVTSIRRLLEQNKSLRRLNVRGTGIQGPEMEGIFEAVLKHPVLTELGVDATLPREVREHLAANRMRHGEWGAGDDVTLIKSVYRTK